MSEIADLSIRFLGREVFSRPMTSEPGLYVKPGGWNGWDEAGGSSREAVPRAGRDGEFDTPVTFGAGTASIDGVALATTTEDLERMRSWVVSTGRAGQRFRIDVRNRGAARWAFARVQSAKFVDSGIRESRLLTADFFLQFVLPDSRKFGETSDTPYGKTIDLRHRGDAPADAVLFVSGPQPAGYEVVCPYGRVVVRHALPSGSVDEIRVSEARVFRDRTLLKRPFSSIVQWRIPDGEAVRHELNGGAGLMYGEAVDAYA